MIDLSVRAFDRQFLSLLAAVIDDPFVVTDADRRHVRWNDALLRMLGVTEQRFADGDGQQVLTALVRPDGTPLLPDLHPDVLALRSGEAVRGLHLGLCRAAGPIGWAIVDSWPIISDGVVVATLTRFRSANQNSMSQHDGESRSVVEGADARDMTAARQQVKALSDRIDTIFDASLIGMSVIRRDGRFERVNPAFARLHRDTIDGILRRDAISLVHPDDRAMVEQFASRALAGHHVTLDHRSLASSDEVQWHRSQLCAIEWDGQRQLLLQTVDQTAHRSNVVESHSMDPVTGLTNRDGFSDHLEEMVGINHRTGAGFALFCLDVEGFRAINDRIGIGAADRLLEQIGVALQAVVAADSIVGRLHGGVFAVVVPDGDLGAAQQSADVIERALATVSQRHVDIEVRLAMGGLVVETGRTAQSSLLSRIEQVTRAARSSSEHRLIELAHDGAADEPDQANSGHVDEIDEALLAERFVAVGEPILDLNADGPSRRYELFVRLEVRDGDRISMPNFSSHADRLGLGARIDEWMLQRSHALLRADADLEVEVNIAPVSLGDESVRRMLEVDLASDDVDPSRLFLALDERVLLRSSKNVVEFVQSIHANGLGLTIDNVGAEAGGVHLFDTFGPSRVKLAPALVNRASISRGAAVILDGVMSAARARQIEVVVPFATDDESIRRAAALGANAVQGRAVGAPVDYR